MPSEVGLWRVDGAPVRVYPVAAKVDRKLEDVIESDPAVLGDALMIVGRQVRTDSGKLIDLLGIDSKGGVHVVALKRDAAVRDLVAQVLEHGAWVQQLSNEHIREVFHRYRTVGDNQNFDQAFASTFGVCPPHSLNDSQALTVVAGAVDAATERVVAYLANYDVPINVVCFSYYEDYGHSYIARTSIIENAHAERERSPCGPTENEQWEGRERFGRLGEYRRSTCSWADPRRYGYICAGAGWPS